MYTEIYNKAYKFLLFFLLNVSISNKDIIKSATNDMVFTNHASDNINFAFLF
jgi:hypothetical protein